MIQRHILIVDNDPAVALVTQQGLQRLLDKDVDVVIAPSLDAARSRCDRDEVDLLIVDPMPQSQAAVTLIKTLRRDRPELPLLVLTAHDNPGLRTQMGALGVRHYLAKPITLVDLAGVVRAVLDGAEAQDGKPCSPPTYADQRVRGCDATLLHERHGRSE